MTTQQRRKTVIQVIVSWVGMEPPVRVNTFTTALRGGKERSSCCSWRVATVRWPKTLQRLYRVPFFPPHEALRHCRMVLWSWPWVCFRLAWAVSAPCFLAMRGSLHCAQRSLKTEVSAGWRRVQAMSWWLLIKWDAGEFIEGPELFQVFDF